MIKYKAYKFRLDPNEDQEILINKTFGCVRFIYNKMLEDKIKAYESDKINLKVSPAQYKEEFEFLKEVDSLALNSAGNNLKSAYDNFFRNIKKGKKAGFPKFKSKRYSRRSYTTHRASVNKDNIRIEDNYIILPKLGKVKFRKSREVIGTIKSATISQNATGKYFVSILVEYEWDNPNYEINIDNSLGLDYASHCLYVDNLGTEINYPRYYRLYENQLAKEQRKLSRMKYESANYLKQRKKVAKIHEKIANSRKDFLHKLSTELANKYDVICVEDLNLKAIAQVLHLGKSTNDNGFGMFRSFLQYKLELQGKKFVKIDKWTPTTVVCSACGSYHKDIVNSLLVREWTCPDCGTHHDRDINAAENIRSAGISLILS